MKWPSHILLCIEYELINGVLGILRFGIQCMDASPFDLVIQPNTYIRYLYKVRLISLNKLITVSISIWVLVYKLHCAKILFKVIHNIIWLSEQNTWVE